jgi:hypothetical protein
MSRTSCTVSNAPCSAGVANSNTDPPEGTATSSAATRRARAIIQRDLRRRDLRGNRDDPNDHVRRRAIAIPDSHRASSGHRDLRIAAIPGPVDESVELELGTMDLKVSHCLIDRAGLDILQPPGDTSDRAMAQDLSRGATPQRPEEETRAPGRRLTGLQRRSAKIRSMEHLVP